MTKDDMKVAYRALKEIPAEATGSFDSTRLTEEPTITREEITNLPEPSQQP